MGTVFKKTVTKTMPSNAELFTRNGDQFAKWKDTKGSTRKARVVVGKDGRNRIAIESPKYIAKYRDGTGRVREVATGCRDEQAARSVLADLERRAELVKAKVMTPVQSSVGLHQDTPIEQHFEAYRAYLEAAGRCRVYRENVERQLNRLAADCSFSRLSDLSREALERWLVARTREGMGPRTRNTYLITVQSFANWCTHPEVRRLVSNPFDGIVKANEEIDVRRKRRAMSEDELATLLDVARRRPLLDALTVRTGKRKGEVVAKVRPAVRARLESLGRERALLYKTLVLTGLRKSELASLTVGRLSLDGPIPFATLAAADEKNRQGAEIMLRADLARELRDWLAERLADLQAEAVSKGLPVPVRLSGDAPLFNVPAGLVRILDRDLKAADIPKRDERGRSLDVHALRTTFGTLLSKGGVAPRTAQAAMRHSKIDLTMNVYTDPRLLDVRGALDALPALPLKPQSETTKATGTAGIDPGQFAPGFAPTSDKSRQKKSVAVKSAGDEGAEPSETRPAVTSYTVNGKGPLTITVNEPSKVDPTGVEPVTSRMPFCQQGDASKSIKQLAPPTNPVCTPVCTNEPKNANETPLDDLAAALLALSEDDRARLAALLTPKQ